MKTGETSQKRVTSADVARVSGVSRATVSYVLNNDPYQSIALETRERVFKAAQELGYRPFTPARILRMGHSQIVLAVLPFEQIDPGLARKLKELEARLAARGLTLICHFGLHLRAGDSHPSLNITPSVILLSYADEDDPVLTAYLQQFQAPVLPAISNKSTEIMIGRMQARHLFQHGKRQLFFAASPREDVHFLSQNRLFGVHQESAALALDVPHVCIMPSSREGARAVIHDLLGRYPLPWGICCYNDEVAFVVIAALTDEGIAIPEAAAVIGCDDIPLAPFSIPSLTTIHFDHEPSLGPLVEAIVAISQGKPDKDVPQSVLSIIERKSV